MVQRTKLTKTGKGATKKDYQNNNDKANETKSWKNTSIIVACLAICTYFYQSDFLKGNRQQFHYEVPTLNRFDEIKSTKDQIETMFLQSWLDYSTKGGWGYDIYHPLSHTAKNMPQSNQPLGWIIVDSIDTIMLMYNSTSLYKDIFQNEILRIENWIKNDLSYKDIDSEVNVFETTIRMLGGLLSAYHLSSLEFQIPGSNPTIYLEKAIELADCLTPAFIQSPTGIPYSSINLKTGQAIKNHQDNGASSTAEFTTLQLEFKYLAYLTKNKTYWELVENVFPPLYHNNDILSQDKLDGLVPIYTFPDTGHFFTENIRLGSRGDSFYEYLSKQFLQTNQPLYNILYRHSVNGIKRHLVNKTHTSNELTYISEKPMGLTAPSSPKMDHLVCFLGGTMAMGATRGLPINKARVQPWWIDAKDDMESDWLLAQELTRTCYEMYHQSPSGLAPEIVVFNDGSVQYEFDEDQDFIVKPLDRHCLQRPETVESIMFMYHLSSNEEEDDEAKKYQYRKWGQEILNSFNDNSCIDCEIPSEKRFTSLDDCWSIPTVKRDNLESFWLAETLKYLYLLFDDEFDTTKLTQWVFTTEAHPLPVLSPEELTNMGLTTTWSL
ncbi:mannosyl-oligosaccharide 1,2-alpha-mannosidase NDAI_0J02870 [Naumovozyma dairenensis CBS 421]|uniref:alpha-1,2-Mannosidase n=1 Tax=Naumovozyma dairenensis (strain ATCC 10597 / BCRC 20456 / CBS 421 / NBRC 0211 / NRRL Y-12639) TaxID=1071378 RepID=G0WHA1_NAUDC|nr:hypothetical protein NDAI_0J02870 [Naumovozyma dairenensis CBS 421]CCD27179.1 hypothetical protein NDAI_0J02870 [Naumovozyma dairenensis CBS 421]